MQKLLLIARHEFIKHLKRVSFIIGTLLLPLLGIAFVLIMSLLEHSSALPFNTSGSNPSLPIANPLTGGGDSEPEEPTKIGYIDHADILVIVTPTVAMSRTLMESTYGFSDTLFLAYPDESTAKQAVQDEEITAYYVLDADYMETGAVTRYANTVKFSAQDRWRFQTFLRANLLRHADKRIITRLGDLLNFEVIRLKENGEPREGRFANVDIDSDDSAMLLLPLAFAMLLYISIFTSAGLLQNSVIEEKENRVLEIVLTSIQPWQMLGGKLLGLGVLGLFQLLIWAGSYGVLIYYDMFREAMLANVTLPLYVWVLLLPYYLFGYLIYGGLMSGIGATMTSTREGSSLTSMLFIPIMLPFLLMFVIIDQPDGWLAVLLSIFPYTASITMIIRLTLVDVVWWQIALSLLFLVGAVILSVKVSAKLFHTTMLLKGKKLTVREVWQALRMSTG